MRPIFVLERSPHDLGRMRGHDEPDAEAAHRAVQDIGRDPARQQTRQCFLDRPRLGTRARITLIRAAPAHAVMLFGDVCEIQEVREAARDRQRGLDRHRAQLVRQRLEPVRRRHARAFGERAHAFHPLEQRLSLLAAQRLAQQFAEQPDVVAQRPMRVDGAFNDAHRRSAQSGGRGPTL